MSEWTFDFRLMGIGAELGTLRTYYDLLVSSYPQMETAAAQEARSSWDLTDPAERQGAWDEERYALQVELPRLIWGSFIVTCWAVFEAAAIEIADFLKKAHDIRLRIVDIRGDLETRIKRYGQDVLQFTFTDFNTPAWEQIAHLGRVRNAIVHYAGRLEVMPESQRDALNKTMDRNIGVSVDDLFGSYIVVGQGFAEASLTAIDSILRDAVERARSDERRVREAGKD